MESMDIIWNIPAVKWRFSYLVNCSLTWVSSHFACFLYSIVKPINHLSDG